MLLFDDEGSSVGVGGGSCCCWKRLAVATDFEKPDVSVIAYVSAHSDTKEAAVAASVVVLVVAEAKTQPLPSNSLVVLVSNRRWQTSSKLLLVTT